MDVDEYAAARRPALVRSAFLLGCNLDDAEDLVQVILTACVARRASEAERPDAYAYRILVNALRTGAHAAGTVRCLPPNSPRHRSSTRTA